MVGDRMNLVRKGVLHGTHINLTRNTRTGRNHFHRITGGESETMRIGGDRIHANALIVHLVGLGGEYRTVIHTTLGRRFDLQQSIRTLDTQNTGLLHSVVVIGNIIVISILHHQSAGEDTCVVTHRLALCDIADARRRMSGNQVVIGKQRRGLGHTALIIHQFVHTSEIELAFMDE